MGNYNSRNIWLNFIKYRDILHQSTLSRHSRCFCCCWSSRNYFLFIIWFAVWFGLVIRFLCSCTRRFSQLSMRVCYWLFFLVLIVCCKLLISWLWIMWMLWMLWMMGVKWRMWMISWRRYWFHFLHNISILLDLTILNIVASITYILTHLLFNLNLVWKIFS